MCLNLLLFSCTDLFYFTWRIIVPLFLSMCKFSVHAFWKRRTNNNYSSTLKISHLSLVCCCFVVFSWGSATLKITCFLWSSFCLFSIAHLTKDVHYFRLPLKLFPWLLQVLLTDTWAWQNVFHLFPIWPGRDEFGCLPGTVLSTTLNASNWKLKLEITCSCCIYNGNLQILTWKLSILSNLQRKCSKPCFLDQGR